MTLKLFSRLLVSQQFKLFSFCLTESNTNRNLSTEQDITEIKSNAQVLWDYLRIDGPLKKSDIILVLGNSDLRTADHAASLYKEGLAPMVVVSGKEGHGTKGRWSKPEAVMFAEQLIKGNVPSNNILLEPKATNTGENIRFSQQLLKDHPDFLQPLSVILVQTPFMGRRALATFQRQWDKANEVDVVVSSPPIELNDYPSPEAGYSSLIDLAREMVRTMDRIHSYPSKGFQVPQHVPSQIMESYRVLQRKVGLPEGESEV